MATSELRLERLAAAAATAGLLVLDRARVVIPESLPGVVLGDDDPTDLAALFRATGATVAVVEPAGSGARALVVGAVSLQILLVAAETLEAIDARAAVEEHQADAVDRLHGEYQEVVDRKVQVALKSLPLGLHRREDVLDEIAAALANVVEALGPGGNEVLRDYVDSTLAYEAHRLRDRHAEEVRQRAEEFAREIFDREGPFAPPFQRLQQRAVVRAWLDDLDPECATKAMGEPVVFHLGELYKEATRAP